MDKMAAGKGRGRGRPPRRFFRGRAGVISCGPRPLHTVHRPPRTVNSQNSEAVVEWLTQHTPSSSGSARNRGASSSSCSDSATPQQLTTPPAATTTTSTTAAPLEMSEELFTHSADEFSDAQPLLLDEGAKDVTPPHMSQLGVTTHMEVRCEDDDEVPAVGAVFELSDTSEAVDDVDCDDDVVMDVTWLPGRRDEEEGDSSDGETERRRRRRVDVDGSRGRSTQRAGGGTGRQQVSAAPPRVSQLTRPSTAAVAAATTTRTPLLHSSPVWHFFSISASEYSNAICNLCQRKLSRGKCNSHLGTTALRRHMLSHHKHQWDEHMRKSSTQPQSHPPPPPPPGPASSVSATCAALAPSQPPSSTQPFTLSGSASSAQSQVSIKDIFERKKLMSPSHPLARRLTSGLSELLARQLLPFQLVDSEAFQKFVAIGTPQWKIPGRHYFSRKAIPKLYRDVEKQVVSSLAHSVGARVHLTTDAWSAKHGQGRYITYTAHWVNLMAAGKHGARGCAAELVTPPRLAGRSAAAADTSSSAPTPPPTSSSVSSSAESCSPSTAALSLPTAHPQLPRAYSACQVRRCHAILDMSCLKAESHTGAALLAALNKQVEQWLTPHQLEIGNVVCDNGSNLLAALNAGKLTHVPCMAHVLNLIVQRFVCKFPGLQDVLKQSRKVCGHFRRSYTAMARLSEIQRQKNLPVRRLVCDSPTRWNSTLLMFDRLLQQEKAVNEYLYSYGARSGSGALGIFLPRYWTLMRNACMLMRPFEEVTNMVSRAEGTISDLIPYTVFLERAVRRVVDEAVQEREREEEELWAPSPPEPDLASTPAVPAAAQREEESGEEEEESEEEADFEEEGGEEPQQASQGACALPSATRGIVRGWGEEENLRDITDEEQDDMTSTSNNLVQMGSFMLSSLLKDPRIKKLKEQDLYWVATLLDPRYKHKVADLLPTYQKAEKMHQLQNKLASMLYHAFKGRGASNPPPPPPSAVATPARTGRSSQLMVMSDLRAFFSPTAHLSPSGSTLRQRLDRQVADYLALSADIDTLSSEEPLDYWVRRLDLWPELSQFAMEMLACPASSVLSERTFSAAGGIVTEKRSRLGQTSVQYLTFIKMNEAWIPEGYSLPEDL